MKDVLLRGAALFLGVYGIAGSVVGRTGAGWDPNVWWIDLRPLPDAAAGVTIGLAGTLIAVWGVLPDRHAWRRRATVAVAGVLAAVAAANAVRVLSLPHARLDAPPLSAVVALVLATIAWHAHRPRHAPRRAAVIGTALAAAVLFPALQMATFGTTDYRRRAHAIVVLGARAYADGRASTALSDRVQTACDLWLAGWAPVLILSGGPGDGDVHETEAMRRIALGRGVPDESIVLDRNGLSTRATAAGAARLLAGDGRGTALVVSHAYHLPRTKIAFERAGICAFTVPATKSGRIPQMPWMVARELAAWWAYAAAP